MRHHVFIACAAFSLMGCASAPAPVAHGYFAMDVAPAGAAALAQLMARDSAKQLAAIYPPAHTRLKLSHPMQDDFGAALTAALRGAGYAVEESATGAPAHDPASTAASPPAPAARTLTYIADQVPELGVWRLTVLIGGQPLSRLYRLDAGAAVPASDWIRKE